ncbi:unnamed protein product [Schistosoma intercalatum]|nr:unnamed protein product [Schistosoma intercalatum]
MKTSSKSSSLTENNRKSLDERKSTLQQIEKQYKESKFNEMQKNIDEMTEHLERYTYPNDRSYLEQFAEDLKQKINDYKANPEVIAVKDDNQHAAMKYFNALDNHLKTLTNMEVQRIDVLECK